MKIITRTLLSNLFIATGLFLANATPADGALSVVEDGQPRAQIIIGEEPERLVKLAAEELRDYVMKISGAELPVGTTPDEAYPVSPGEFG